MKQKWVVATKNPGKAREFAALLSGIATEVVSLLDIPDAPDVAETGRTFQENALLKAETIARQLEMPVIADDSGLCVDALNGRPGVYSARYAGPEKNDDRNIALLLHEMAGIPWPERTARFVCVIALSEPKKESKTYEGICEGLITTERRGSNGFGYDPVFYVPEKGKTFAEMTDEEKNAVSHRARALAALQADFGREGA